MSFVGRKNTFMTHSAIDWAWVVPFLSQSLSFLKSKMVKINVWVHTHVALLRAEN